MVLTVAVGSGCSGHSPRLPGVEVVADADRVEFATTETAEPAYTLANGDMFEVTFLFEGHLNTRVTVRPDGKVALPIVGEVQAAGRSPAELDSMLTAAYAKYYQQPEVTVNVVKFAPPAVYILGEVQRPGMVKLTPGMTMLQAIAERGGPVMGANIGSVMLLRRMGGKKAVAERVDLERVLEGKERAQDLLLAPYDIVYVPASFITRVNRFVDQFFAKMTPIPQLYLRGWESFHSDRVYIRY